MRASIPRGLTSALSRIEGQLESVRADIDKLKHVIMEGNGSPSLMVSVATQNERLKSLEETAGMTFKERATMFSALGLSLAHILARIAHLL